MYGNLKHVLFILYQIANLPAVRLMEHIQLRKLECDKNKIVRAQSRLHTIKLFLDFAEDPLTMPDSKRRHQPNYYSWNMTILIT